MTGSDIYTDGEYLRRYPTWHDEHAVAKADLVSSILARNGLLPASVCDIGCGTGGVIVELSRRLPINVTFAGYDISPSSAGVGRDAAKWSDPVYEGGVPEPDQMHWDLALCLDVVEHVEDQSGFLRALAHVAEHHIFNFPLDLSAWSVLRKAPIESRLTMGHLHCFTKELALALLSETGFVPVDWFYERYFDRPRLPRRGRVSQVIRSAAYRANPDLAVRALGGWSLVVLTSRDASLLGR